jgi:DNA-binding MarR family transcriptional regulator
MARTPKKRSKLADAKFDFNGVRKAIIATLESLYKSGRFNTIADILIAMEVIDAQLDGQPHSMRSLSDKFGVSYSSISRIVFGLTAEGSEGPGILTLRSHGEDRRRKVIGVDPAAFEFFGKEGTGSGRQICDDTVLRTGRQATQLEG